MFVDLRMQEVMNVLRRAGYPEDQLLERAIETLSPRGEDWINLDDECIWCDHFCQTVVGQENETEEEDAMEWLDYLDRITRNGECSSAGGK